jgi:hypothetical protein
MLRMQRLTVRTIQGRWWASVITDGMSWDEGLRLS